MHALIGEMGPAASWSYIMVVWALRIVVMALICAVLGWLGLRVLDALTPAIRERERIGEHPVSIGLFIAGFFIFAGLVIHGVATAPIAITSSLWSSLIDWRRLCLLGVSYIVALLLTVGLFNLVDRLTPTIPFKRVEESPVAVGIYVFGYYVFNGLIIHAALTASL